jgi:hypothetical protein
MEVITQRSFSLKRAVVEWDTTEVYDFSLIPIVTAQLHCFGQNFSAENQKESYLLHKNKHCQ